MKTIRLWLVVPILFLALSAFCADTNSVSPIDEKITAAVAKFSYWQGMVLPFTMVLVYAIKKYVKLIPDKWLPVAAPIVGGLLDMAAQKFGLWTGSPAVGALMGTAATWAHQVWNQHDSSIQEEKP